MDLEKIIFLLERGGLVSIPTDTVYGLAANGLDATAIARIYAVKKRPAFNPLILHYGHAAEMTPDIIWTEQAWKLAQTFWPGPLTLILQRAPSCRIPLLASAGLSTLAVRIPDHPALATLFSKIPFPLAAPSANLSGNLSPTLASHVHNTLGQSIDGILDGGPCPIGLESTVISAAGPNITLLRPGGVDLSAIETVLGQNVHFPPQSPIRHHASPGLSDSHYAPKQPLRLNAHDVQPEEGLLAFGPNPYPGGLMTENLSCSGDLIEAASQLFKQLHILEASSCKQIAVMPIPEQGLGFAINDRLRRAAAPRCSFL